MSLFLMVLVAPCRHPLLQQDQQLVVRQDTYLDSRAAALQNVESTIHELGGIFQQLAHMVRRCWKLTCPCKNVCLLPANYVQKSESRGSFV